MNSNFFKLSGRDIIKAFVSAAIIGALLPVAAAIQSPDFSIFAASWGELAGLALNGALIGFVGELSRRLLTSSDGKFLGGI